MKIISEPVEAALSFGYMKIPDKKENILVYDLGACTIKLAIKLKLFYFLVYSVFVSVHEFQISFVLNTNPCFLYKLGGGTLDIAVVSINIRNIPRSCNERAHSHWWVYVC